MTVKELSHVLALTEFTLPQPEREVTGPHRQRRRNRLLPAWLCCKPSCPSMTG